MMRSMPTTPITTPSVVERPPKCFPPSLTSSRYKADLRSSTAGICSPAGSFFSGAHQRSQQLHRFEFAGCLVDHLLKRRLEFCDSPSFAVLDNDYRLAQRSLQDRGHIEHALGATVRVQRHLVFPRWKPPTTLLNIFTKSSLLFYRSENHRYASAPDSKLP